MINITATIIFTTFCKKPLTMRFFCYTLIVQTIIFDSAELIVVYEEVMGICGVMMSLTKTLKCQLVQKDMELCRYEL